MCQGVNQSIMATGQVLCNIEIAPSVFQMDILLPDIAKNAKAGQFVEVYVDHAAHLLPRPISICGVDREKGQITLVYQRVGKGTARFAELSPGSTLRVLGPLGNGYEITDAPFCILAGGGIGTPPLLRLAAELREKKAGCVIHAFLGFRSQPFLSDAFQAYCDQVHIATDDGSVGFHGNVVQLMKRETERASADIAVYACGPRIMLRATADWAAEKSLRCQISMEERMACGVGACVGCAIMIRNERGWDYKKVCKDGPVFDAGEVVWDA